MIFEFPFTTGEQYELYEFDLEFIKIVFIGKYEYVVYRYIKNDIKVLLGFEVKEIHLYYNADILAKVVYFLIVGST